MKRLLLAALMSGCGALAVYAKAPAPIPPPDHILPPTGRIGELVPTMKLDPTSSNDASSRQTARAEQTDTSGAGTVA